jgi:hypothetical protein
MTREEELILKLTADLRRMDQYIYRMSQCPDHKRFMDVFREALIETEARMLDESNRIRAVLVPEIVRTYATHQQTQGHSRSETPQLEGPKDAGAARIPHGGREHEGDS